MRTQVLGVLLGAALISGPALAQSSTSGGTHERHSSSSAQSSTAGQSSTSSSAQQDRNQQERTEGSGLSARSDNDQDANAGKHASKPDITFGRLKEYTPGKKVVVDVKSAMDKSYKLDKKDNHVTVAEGLNVGDPVRVTEEKENGKKIVRIDRYSGSMESGQAARQIRQEGVRTDDSSSSANSADHSRSADQSDTSSHSQHDKSSDQHENPKR